MELYPEDLGTYLEADIQRGRDGRKRAATPFPLPNTYGAFLLVAVVVTILFLLLQLYGLAFLSGAALLYLLVAYIRQALCYYPEDDQAYHTSLIGRVPQIPVKVFEVEAERPYPPDPLMRKYFSLVSGIIRSGGTADADSEREVRGALQALGNTIPALPADDAKIVTDDPRVLRTEAGKMAGEAEVECDAVIAASLHRRVESLLRRADTAERTLLLLRRNQALRAEIAEQMDALSTSLTAFSVGGRQSAPELSGLAARIQSVAHEANAITAARAEVDTLVTEPYRIRETQNREQETRVIGG